MHVNYYEAKIGYDPELFFKNKLGNIVPFSKLEPKIRDTIKSIGRPIGLSGEMVFKVDGVAAELNGPPTHCRDYLVPGMAQAFNALEQARKNFFPNYHLSIDAGGTVSKRTFSSLEETYRELGCNPDYNGYSLRAQQPHSDEVGLYRTTGGHLHFSWKQYDFNQKIKDMRNAALFAIYCDFWLALPTIVMLGERHQESEAKRRLFYGKPGSFRIQSHGIEYRTLSSRGLLQSPVWTYAMMENLRSVGFGLELNEWAHPTPKMVNSFFELEDIIASHSVDRAISFFETHKKNSFSLPNWRKATSAGNFGSDVVHFLMSQQKMDGVWSDDFVFNWGIEKPFKKAISHNYWGDRSAMAGTLSNIIFPLNNPIHPYQFHPSEQNKSIWSK